MKKYIVNYKEVTYKIGYGLWPEEKEMVVMAESEDDAIRKVEEAARKNAIGAIEITIK